MILIILIIVLFIACMVFYCIYDEVFEECWGVVCIICGFLGIGLLIYGCFHGFINYPPTKGSHQGVITAVDLEGIYFRRYKVYLKSSAYTEQGDETEYCVYIDESKLIEDLQKNIGKKVKLNYSHKGGYIGWKSCGTYHIDNVEQIEDNDDRLNK